MEKVLAEKNLVAVAWGVLIGVLLLGLTVHGNDWSTYWALWLTEAATFGLIIMFFFRPSNMRATITLIGSIVWLINQLACWYLLQAFPAMAIGTLINIYIVTAIINGGLLAYSVFSGETAYKTKVSDTNVVYGLGIMAAFAALKLYAAYGTFTFGTAVANSAYLWGLGILFMSLGSILRLKLHKNKEVWGNIIVLLGLLLASVTALYYGLALSELGQAFFF